MPEGHSIHRLALAFRELFGGQRLAVSSPQGRFAAGAALLDGRVLGCTEAHGKQLFLGFVPDGDEEGEPAWLRVHLGLYGSWTFAGDTTFSAPHAIGAPRRRVGEEERPLDAGEDALVPRDWEPPAPRGAVRVRLLGEHGVADLTGPAACEVIAPAEKDAVHARLGPDPLRGDADPEVFVAEVRRRRRAVGELLMDQTVISGVGNIYRAESLFRARLHPRRLGRDVPAGRLRELWADLACLMAEGVETGRIVTVRPEHRPAGDGPRERLPDEAGPPDADPDAEARRWYVYHRSGRPCLVCGASVAEATMQSRRLFWCPRCQRAPR